ncbi:MAG: tetratricopeptide repeat protein [Candidatus Latescibacteria bacterium]|nr:tetratricopeptide repeat protein [Candidatus Latescibacterota bacterium]
MRVRIITGVNVTIQRPFSQYSGILRAIILGILIVMQGCAASNTATTGDSSNTPTISEIIEAGNVLVAEGNYDQAIAQFNRALALDIASADAHGNLGVALYYAAKYDDAITESQQAIVMAPNELNWRLNLGASYTRKQDTERAISAYEGAVGLARRLRDENRSLLRSALIGLGRACETIDRHQQALDAYREALVFAPGDPDLLAGIGNIFFRQERYDEAQDFYQQVLDIDPTSSLANYNLGLVYARKGDYEKAIALFTETPDLPEEMVGTIEGTSLTAANRSRTNRIEAFRSKLGQMGGTTAPSRSGKPPPYTYALGLTYYDQGDDEAAIDAFSRALSEDEGLAEAHLYIGNVRVRQGLTEQAIGAYGEALRVDPDLAAAHNNMGSLYAESGDSEAAMEAYRLALALNPRFHDARTNLGLLYAEAGRYDEAIVEYESVIKADMGIAEAHNNLSMIYLNQSRLEDAIAESRKAIRLRKDFPEAYNNLGLAYGHRVFFDDIVDAWRNQSAGWIGINSKSAEANSQQSKSDWLLLRRIPSGSSDVGGRARTWYTEGADQAFLGLYDDAARSFDRALEVRPEWPAATLALGTTYLAQERWADAAQVLSSAVSLENSDPLASATLSIAWMMHGEYTAAVESWKQVVRTTKDEAQKTSRESLDIARERQEMANEALDALNNAVTLDPDFAKAHFNLGILYDQIHRYPAAIIAYEKVADLSPEIPVIHFRLGVAYSRVGRIQEAQAAIQRYIAMVADPMLLPQVETFLKRMN